MLNKHLKLGSFNDSFKSSTFIYALHAEPFHGSQTGEVLCAHCHTMLTKWEINELVGILDSKR